MSEVMIDVSHLSKKYRIGAREEGYKTFREAIVRGVTAPARNLKRLQDLTRFREGQGDEADVFWALRDVSFQVKEGEVLGIVGRNGAGKSTLLKIIARITEPSEGRIDIYGRVSSLLEVGTGFHPELTGRENIFLNGAILGMRKREIERKFDDIVGFAEIDKFLDTPVKRYSSGMYVRLAFAVAAHLEPEILLVDEVLAVGDIAFQQKCLGKMEEVAKGGRTVVFVSHNMSAVGKFCRKVVWIDCGQLRKIGPAEDVIRAYEKKQLELLSLPAPAAERNLVDTKRKDFYLCRVEKRNILGEPKSMFKYNDKLVLIVDFDGELTSGEFSPEFRIFNSLGQLVTTGASGQYHGQYFTKDTKTVRIVIGPLTLTSGDYRISLSVMTTRGLRADTWDNATGFSIIECKPFAQPHDMPTCVEGACIIAHTFSKAANDDR